MRAMVLRRVGPLSEHPDPLTLEDVPLPAPKAGEVRVRVQACGVCHTELDEIEGRATPPSLPRIPGHQVIGIVEAVGPGAPPELSGTRVGVAWIFRACGACEACRSGHENLCPFFEGTGLDADGGYAEYMVAPAAFVYPIPDALDSVAAAPLLCAGAIGYRSLSLTGIRDGQPLGLTGFGASGHLVMGLSRHLYPRSTVYVFARSATEREFARELGAVWAGDSGEPAPVPLAAIIDTTPAWRPVVRALEALAPGGRLVINAIRKSDADKDALLSIDYPAHLWKEKTIQSVANVTREDVRRCLALAAESGVRPTVAVYPLEEANTALRELSQGGARGAKVLSIG